VLDLHLHLHQVVQPLMPLELSVWGSILVLAFTMEVLLSQEVQLLLLILMPVLVAGVDLVLLLYQELGALWET
jgi:hypothetical protein